MTHMINHPMITLPAPGTQSPTNQFTIGKPNQTQNAGEGKGAIPQTTVSQGISE
jgi:hypothetical protein